MPISRLVQRDPRKVLSQTRANHLCWQPSPVCYQSSFASDFGPFAWSNVRATDLRSILIASAWVSFVRPSCGPSWRCCLSRRKCGRMYKYLRPPPPSLVYFWPFLCLIKPLTQPFIVDERTFKMFTTSKNKSYRDSFSYRAGKSMSKRQKSFKEYPPARRIVAQRYAPPSSSAQSSPTTTGSSPTSP